MRKLFCCLCLLLCLTGCQQIGEVYLDPSAPVLHFTPVTHTPDGKPMYYLFDDNPEHLNDRFLADHPAAPSTIARFGELTPGIYTVFSYHHRGYSVDLQADLYFDTAFSSTDGGTFRLLALGLDHDWDWNQAWADYTGTPVAMPEFLRTYDCTCTSEISKGDADFPHDPACPAIIRNAVRTPRTAEIQPLQQLGSPQKGEPILLSEWIGIGE